MLSIMFRYGIDSDFAASNCPLSTDSIPPLIISETYAAEFKERAKIPATNIGMLVFNSPGRAK